jgi:hypothetical protein
MKISYSTAHLIQDIVTHFIIVFHPQISWFWREAILENNVLIWWAFEETTASFQVYPLWWSFSNRSKRWLASLQEPHNSPLTVRKCWNDVGPRTLTKGIANKNTPHCLDGLNKFHQLHQWNIHWDKVNWFSLYQ